MHARQCSFLPLVLLSICFLNGCGGPIGSQVSAPDSDTSQLNSPTLTSPTDDDSVAFIDNGGYSTTGLISTISSSATDTFTPYDIALGGFGSQLTFANGPNNDRDRTFPAALMTPWAPAFELINNNATFGHMVAGNDATDVQGIIYDEMGINSSTFQPYVRIRHANSQLNCTYTWPVTVNGHNYRAVRVTAAGTVIAAFYNGFTNTTQIKYFPNGNCQPTTSFEVSLGTAFANIDASDDGKVLISNNLVTKLYSANGTLLFTNNWFGAFYTAAISRDGTKFAVSFNNDVLVYTLNNGQYVQSATDSAGAGFVANALALSDNGILLAGYNNTSNNSHGIALREKDIVNNVLRWDFRRANVGGLQDTVAKVAIAADGNRGAAATWGDNMGAPQVFVVGTGPVQPLAAYNTAGSAFDIEISRDGMTVVASGKGAHANNTAGGGWIDFMLAYRTDILPVGVARAGQPLGLKIWGNPGSNATLYRASNSGSAPGPNGGTLCTSNDRQIVASATIGADGTAIIYDPIAATAGNKAVYQAIVETRPTNKCATTFSVP